MQGDTVAVQKVVMDFEKALWPVVKSMINVIVMGCVSLYSSDMEEG